MGLAITQMMAIAGLVQWGMRQSAEVTNQLMSVERILEYTQILPENNLRDRSVTIRGKKGRKSSMTLVVPPKDWPSAGSVVFRSVFMRYSEQDEPVLRDLSFLIKPTEKVCRFKICKIRQLSS